jgi:hypothetical protein
MTASWNQDQAGIEARTAGHQRRVDEWTLQANLAARELAQTGRQIIASLIAEQVAQHDYKAVKNRSSRRRKSRISCSTSSPAPTCTPGCKAS